MNGGQKAYWNLLNKPITLQNLHNELVDIRSKLAEKFPDEFNACKQKREAKGKDWNHKGALVALLLNDIENKILMTMLAWLYDKGLVQDDCVLCFDGFLIPKRSGINI